MLKRIVAGNRTGAGYTQSPYNMDGTQLIFNIVPIISFYADCFHPTIPRPVWPETTKFMKN